jgi:hypothetical protein
MEPDRRTEKSMAPCRSTAVSVPETKIRYHYCGRFFSSQEINHIRDLIASDQRYNRAQLSRVVCENLRWLRPDGRLKDMSCRVAMLRMQNDGLIRLPPPKTINGNGRIRPLLTSASECTNCITTPVHTLGQIELHRVDTTKQSRLWNELIERYHYLGYKPLPGAQMRYLVEANKDIIAAIGFGAAAWTVAPRDQWIRWDHKQRRKNLHLVVNNARFLILPWVKSKNLASKLLACSAKQLPKDWENKYSYKPVLLETFVQKNKFAGTCYRAANWIKLGDTKGRGKLDVKNEYNLPIKTIYVYPLSKNACQLLRS